MTGTIARFAAFLFATAIVPGAGAQPDERQPIASIKGEAAGAGMVEKALLSPEQRAASKASLAMRRAGRPDVAGLIIEYRDGDRRKAAREARPLETAELARFERVTGKAFASGRPMFGERYVVRLARPVDLAEGEAIAGRLAMSPDIARVYPDTIASTQVTPNDEFFPQQWSLGTGAGGIRATSAWDVTQGSSSVVVGIVDSGILPDHPDLAGRIVQGADTITSAASARDGDGRDTNATDLGTYGTAAECGSATDSSWHGTHVAGIIGANSNNGIGISGVDWRARLLPVRSLGRCGTGTSADIIDGIAWAAGFPVPGLPANPNPARIINASLGGPGSCSVYHPVLTQLTDRGAVLIAAAGNNNDNALNYVPASCALALTVSSVGPTGEKASYSNYSGLLEATAPGGDFGLRGQSADLIRSTVSAGTQAHAGTYAYNFLQGTSQAAPHVTGIAALMLSVAPNLTLAQIRDTITLTSRPYPAGSRCATRADCGPGIVDAAAAVNRARSLVGVSTNYSSLWYVPSESGWGLNLQQQGNIVFGTWFTYDAAGNASWYVMPNMGRVSDDYFEGPIYATTGVPLHQINGARATRSVTPVGTAGVQFFNANKAFFYAVMGTTRIEKQVLIQQFSATLPACSFTTGSRSGANNYTDLWYNAAEDGWGINLAHQGDIIFATWFTYNNSGAPVWLVSDALRRQANGSYTGPVYLTTGRRPQDINGTDAIIAADNAGTLTLTFQDGERATMAYTVAGTSGSKSITRQVWSSPLSLCRN